ncbi:MAG: hypothetical protein MI810_02020 [Flavobacteriales bacterium]|nr:hypothetical protein [Flavobacteriales bacterium]
MHFQISDYQKSPYKPKGYQWQEGPGDWDRLLAKQDGLSVVSTNKELGLLNSDGSLIWEKKTICPSIPSKAFISDNGILVLSRTEDYHAWGFLGPALFIDLTSGKIIKEVKGQKGLALGDGKFLVGLEGYDYFETWLYDDKGNLLQEWRSYGYYLLTENQDIIVIEQDRRTPTNSHLVRLKTDGNIQKGFKLDSCSASEPLILNKGIFAFVNSGNLKVVDKDLNLIEQLNLLNISERETWRFQSKIRWKGEQIEVELTERTKEPPLVYTQHLWSITIKNT